jgi:hypothetical protein
VVHRRESPGGGPLEGSPGGVSPGGRCVEGSHGGGPLEG